MVSGTLVVNVVCSVVVVLVCSVVAVDAVVVAVVVTWPEIGVPSSTTIGSFNNSLFFNPLPTSQLLIIEFLADLASPNNFISENIKLSLLEHVAFFYENRGKNKHFDLNIYSKFRTIKY
ncbi:MAG: hypothetical protein MRQ09_06690 [Candidatus Midichloria sp.]|nr:hypothetical protein [Candidatus Midichloria sp.]